MLFSFHVNQVTEPQKDCTRDHVGFSSEIQSIQNCKITATVDIAMQTGSTFVTVGTAEVATQTEYDLFQTEYDLFQTRSRMERSNEISYEVLSHSVCHDATPIGKALHHDHCYISYPESHDMLSKARLATSTPKRTVFLDESSSLQPESAKAGCQQNEQVSAIKVTICEETSINEDISTPLAKKQDPSFHPSYYTFPTEDSYSTTLEDDLWDGIRKEKKLIVFESNLDSVIFKIKCETCGQPGDECKKTRIGTSVLYHLNCIQGHTILHWYSQPNLGKMPAGNLLCTAATFLSGETYAHMNNFAQFMNLQFLGHSQFFKNPIKVDTVSCR